MNIVVKTAAGHCIVRPDTTWEKDSEDFFAPEFVRSVSFAPVVFAHICKPGRSVGRKFAPRYYDGISYGLLLYPDGMMDGSEEAYAAACCLDHISFLPYPVTVQAAGGEFKLNMGGKEIFSCPESHRSVIEDAIAESTRYIYIRTGDLIAVELQPRRPLCSESARISATLAGEPLLDFRIIL